MVPIKSFILQYLHHNQFVFCFWKWKYYIEKHLVANFTRFILIYKHHLHSTTNIFNLQKWYQNTWNCKSLFHQIFIVHKTFTVGIKTKNLPRTTRFYLWLFCKGDQLSKTNTFYWSQDWFSYTGLTLDKIKSIFIVFEGIIRWKSKK